MELKTNKKSYKRLKSNIMFKKKILIELELLQIIYYLFI